METELGASGVWTVQGLPGRGHRTDSRDKRSLGERRGTRKKTQNVVQRGRGNVQGACPGRVQTRMYSVTANSTMRSRESKGRKR